MVSLNKVTLIGHVGKDPVIRPLSNSAEVASFSLATSESWKDKATGEKRERTDWHSIVVYNTGLVSLVKNYVKKGSKIYIEGSLQTRKWNDQHGAQKQTIEVVLQLFGGHIILLDSHGKGGGEQSTFSESTDETDYTDESEQLEKQVNAYKNKSNIDLDMIPF